MNLLKLKKPSDTPRRPRVQQETKPTFVSYHANRKSYDEMQKPKREENIRLLASENSVRRNIIAIFVTGVILVCTYLVTSLGSKAQVVITNPSGVKALRSTKAYQEAVDETLGDSVLNRNKITIDSEKLSAKLRERFPELDTASVVLPLFGGSPTVELITARPALLLTSQSGVYVVSSTGKVMISAKEVNSVAGMALPTVNEESDLNVQVGKGVLSKQDVTFITTVVQQFAFQKVKIKSLTLPPLASELRVAIEEQPYYIKFSLLTDPQITTGQYFALRNKLSKDHIIPAEYVDSRIEEKIYYR